MCILIIYSKIKGMKSTQNNHQYIHEIYNTRKKIMLRKYIKRQRFHTLRTKICKSIREKKYIMVLLKTIFTQPN